jgi:hypothetical protein
VRAVTEVTARPPAPEAGGLTGAVRRLAYAVPEHRARRWMLLLAADRMEWLGWRLGRTGRAVSVALALALLGAVVRSATTRRGRRER